MLVEDGVVRAIGTPQEMGAALSDASVIKAEGAALAPGWLICGSHVFRATPIRKAQRALLKQQQQAASPEWSACRTPIPFWIIPIA